MNAEHTPVLIGAGQWIQREVDPTRAVSPLDSLEVAARGAAEDAEIAAVALGALDTIALVDSLGWKPSNGPRLLAERLGAVPGAELQGGLGGETSQRLVNEVADRIREGRSQLALVATTNNLYTRMLAQRDGVHLELPDGGAGTPELLFGARPGTSKLEEQYGLMLPTQIYPLFENALRVHRGLSLSEHRAAIGELFAPFTRRAAANPYAWFPIERTAEQLSTPSAENRMIVFPYTKYLNAVMMTDQAAALILCSEAKADALGVPADRRVYWHGGGCAVEDPWFVSERPSLATCPALASSVRVTLERAGAAMLEQVEAFDLYSCFPAAVSMACEMLGLSEMDPRDFTVTGGLPYAGGPGNGYTLHSTASMVDWLRARPGALGLVTGNGWYLTKHSASLLGSRPPEHELVAPDPVETPQTGKLELLSVPPSEGVIETYALMYDRDGVPNRCTVIARDREQRRFLAQTPSDRDLLAELETSEPIGRSGRVRADPTHTVFEPA